MMSGAAIRRGQSADLPAVAQILFRRLGYIVIDRRQVSDDVKQSAEFRSRCPISAICMSKALHIGQLSE